MISADSMILLPWKPQLSKMISPKPIFSLLPSLLVSKNGVYTIFVVAMVTDIAKDTKW